MSEKKEVLVAWCLGCGTIRQPWDLMNVCSACGNAGTYFTYQDLDHAMEPVHDVIKPTQDEDDV